MESDKISAKDRERAKFFALLVEALAREAAQRDHDAAESIKRTL